MNMKKGTKISEESKKKISLGLKGIVRSSETRTKMSLSRKGKKLGPMSAEWLERNKRTHPKGKSYNYKGGYENKLLHNRLRRNRKLNAEGYHSEGEWETLKAQYNWTCPSCKKSEVKLTRDHIIPLTKGGSDNIENIQPLCQSCNSRKNNKHTTKYEN